MTPLTTPIFDFHSVISDSDSDSVASENQPLIRFVCLQEKDLPSRESIKDAAVLLNLGDSVTTDHISPAGSISRTSPAARYLAGRG